MVLESLSLDKTFSEQQYTDNSLQAAPVIPSLMQNDVVWNDSAVNVHSYNLCQS